MRTLKALAFSTLLGLATTATAQTYSLANLFAIGSTGTVAHAFLTNDHSTRGIAYNPVTGHLLVPSRTLHGDPAISNAVHILDGDTGAVLGRLPWNHDLIKGGNFAVNMIGITTNGVIYVANLTSDTTNVATGPFRVYRWMDETAQPELVYSGDPSNVSLTGSSPRRYGDSFVVRGSGTSTEILAGTFNQTVALLTTTDGNQFTAKSITTDMAAGDSRYGLVWGKGNKFWVKQPVGGLLKELTLDAAAGTAAVARSIGAWSLAADSALMDIDWDRDLLAIVDARTGHSLRFFDFSDPTVMMELGTARPFGGTNANGNLVGAVSFRKGRLYALDTNRGLLGYVLTNTAVNVTLWEGANWTHKATQLVDGPHSYQWLFEGSPIAGATGSSFTVTNMSEPQIGTYAVSVTEPRGTFVRTASAVTMTQGNNSGTMTNIWDLLPNSRPYLTPGYKEYGVALNPVTTNVIVVTRVSPTNMIAVIDGLTGEHKHYMDYTGLIPSGNMNKVDVADDGVVYVCNQTTTAGAFTIYGFGSDEPYTTDRWEAYKGDPGAGYVAATAGYGRTMDVRGSALNTEILVGTLSATERTVAILVPIDENYQFRSIPIYVADAPAGFARFGLCWGPGTNTLFGKTTSNLILVEYDTNSQSGFVKKTFPVTGARSVPKDLTGQKFDKNFNLMAGVWNGTRPVSVPAYDVSDLEAGPFWADQELFTTYNPDIEYQGNVDFAKGYLVALGVNNGVKMFKINGTSASRPVIVSAPVSGAWHGGSSPILTVVSDSLTPQSYQWYFEGQAIAGATGSSYTLTNLQSSAAGKYRVLVTNAGGEKWSLISTISVLPTYTTGQMTNLWTVPALSRPYLNNNYYEYGMSFNPMNSNVLIASYVPTNTPAVIIAVVDGLTGTHKHTLDVNAVTGGNRWVNKINVADDGVVYAGNRTTDATSIPFMLYRWANDNADTYASVAYYGDPAPSLATKVSGYTMDVRGAGVNTEIILGYDKGNVVTILTTTDGLNFNPTEITVPDAPAAFSRLSVTWGAGNTFWCKMYNGSLYLIQYNLTTGQGTILRTYDTAKVPASMTTLAYNDNLKFLAGAARDTVKNIILYSVADLDKGPIKLDQELYPTYNESIEANGALDFGGNTYLFGMNENNGVMAFMIDPGYKPNFKMLGIEVKNGTVSLTWEAQAGQTYQVKAATSLTGEWQNAGAAVTATGTTATYSEAATEARFYRVVTP